VHTGFVPGVIEVTAAFVLATTVTEAWAAVPQSAFTLA